MEDVFMFSAQLEPGKDAAVKEKPLDINSGAKRARAIFEDDESRMCNPYGESFKSKLLSFSISVGRVGHNKDACMKSVVNHKEKAQVFEDRPSFSAPNSVPGKASSDNRQDIGPPSHRTKTSGKVMGNGKETVTPPRVLYGWKVIHYDRVDINRVPFTASKYRVSAGTNKGYLTRPLKENLCGEHKGTINKGINKGKQISTEMGEELKDPDVLKILHKDMLDSVVSVNISPSLGLDGCISVPGEGQTGSDDLGNGVVRTSSPRQVDMSTAKDLDVVASNLHEAMDLALE
ncbi:hypothetical protein QYF36_025287 [Acer negundo]|nr:hypothetical protein QYF36_025287 [Acer negundo]